MSIKMSILVKSTNLRGIYSLKSWPPIQVVIHTEKQITWPEFKCHQNRWKLSMFGIHDWKLSILFSSSLDTILTDSRWFFSLRNVLGHMWQWSAPPGCLVGICISQSLLSPRKTHFISSMCRIIKFMWFNLK